MSAALPLSRRRRLEAMEGTHFWSLGRDRLSEILIERFGMEAPLLDAGAGSGAFARRLRARHAPVHAFDLGDGTGSDLRASVTSIPFRAGSVATVLARDVLEHVDDRAALAECHRVLRPGGHLLLMVPAWPSLWGPRDEAAGHLRRYTRSRLRSVVEGAGFEVAELRGYQFFLLPLLFASRLVARVLSEKHLDAEERIPGPVGRALALVNTSEARLGRWRWARPPTGSSLCLVARKP